MLQSKAPLIQLPYTGNSCTSEALDVVEQNKTNYHTKSHDVLANSLWCLFTNLCDSSCFLK